MCEVHAYLLEDDKKTLLMESIDTVEPEGQGIRLINIFGEQKLINAKFYSLSMEKHKIYLQKKV